jgi:hypothetical protein
VKKDKANLQQVDQQQRITTNNNQQQQPTTTTEPNGHPEERN